MPLQQCQRSTSSREFLEWQEFFRKQRKESYEDHTKSDYYLAQIAYEVARTMVKPTKWTKKLEDFLLKFAPPTQSKKPRARVNNKNKWLRAFGIKK